MLLRTAKAIRQWPEVAGSCMEAIASGMQAAESAAEAAVCVTETTDSVAEPSVFIATAVLSGTDFIRSAMD